MLMFAVTDRPSHPRPYQALAWRTHSLRTFPTRPLANARQHLRHHLHCVHLLLLALAGVAEDQCYLYELECAARGRYRSH